jgi:DNA (cytosine-5)-methyltransferase 1
MVHAIEIDKNAANTYSRNFPTARVAHCDVENYLRMLLCVEDLRKKYVKSVKQIPIYPKVQISSIRTNPYSKRYQFFVDGRWLNSSQIDTKSIAHFIREKFQTYPGPNDINLIIGGPPCQGYSLLNRHKSTDPMTCEKNRHILVFLALCNFLRPDYVLIENVPNMMQTTVPEIIRNHFAEMEYTTQMGELNATQYGLPQKRARVFIWACRKGREIPKFPLSSYAFKRTTATVVERRKLLTVHPMMNQSGFLQATNLRDFIGDLPINDNNVDIQQVSQ